MSRWRNGFAAVVVAMRQARARSLLNHEIGELVVANSLGAFALEPRPDLERLPARLFRCPDPWRPRPRVALRRPLPRGVDAHLAPVRRQLSGIVQIVNRPA